MSRSPKTWLSKYYVMFRKMIPPKTKDPAQAQRRKEILLKVAKICKHSGLFVLACKSYAAVSGLLRVGR